MKDGRFDIMESAESSKRRRTLEKVKTACIVILIVVVAVLAVKIALTAEDSGGGGEGNTAQSNVAGGRPLLSPAPTPADGPQLSPEMCNSEACVATAHRLFKSMNLTVDPCEDFNQFACGRFIRDQPIPEDKGSSSNFNLIADNIYKQGRTLLEEPVSPDDWEVFKKVKLFYQSCMDEDNLDRQALGPLKDKLPELGGWPVLAKANDTWRDEADFRWYDLTYRFHQMGFAGDQMVSLTVDQDAKDNSVRTLYLDQPSLGMNREYLVKGFDNTDVQHYYKYMTGVAKLMGAEPVGRTDEEMAEVLHFEIALANISAPREERRNETKLYNPTTLGQFASLAEHPASWRDFSQAMLAQADVQVGNKDKVVVRNPAFFASLSALLSRTPRRVQANYLYWRLALSAVDLLDDAANKLRARYKKAIEGVSAAPPRWKKCVLAAGFNTFHQDNFVIPAGSMYVRRYFSPEAKTTMVEMIEYVRKAFSQILEQIDWMDASTKAQAGSKMNSMTSHIAYPDEILDESLVDALHADLAMDPADYFGNVLRLKLWRRRIVYGRLRQPVDKSDWKEHALIPIVNAFYNPLLNTMEFPAGILQSVFFHHEAPRSLNFGAIGAVIGHELTHGFDDSGRQYDEEGNLQNWWAPTTSQEYVRRTQCMIEQYGNYHSEQVDLKLNGVTTQGENIADNGGLKEALIGYEHWVSDHHTEPRLPGLPFTPRQLFWISWGQVWCTRFRDAALKNQILTGAHSPGRFRIVGPLSNSELFARDFKCRPGAKMNPEKKCQVW